MKYDLLGGLKKILNRLSTTWDDSIVVLKVRNVIFQGFSKFGVSKIFNLKISASCVKEPHA